jgi:hypothetical protein
MCGVSLSFVLLRRAEAVLACPGFEEYAAYLPELVSMCCVTQRCLLLCGA